MYNSEHLPHSLTHSKTDPLEGPAEWCFPGLSHNRNDRSIIEKITFSKVNIFDQKFCLFLLLFFAAWLIKSS